MLRVSRQYPAIVTIDGERVRLQIKKLTIDEWSRFTHEFQRFGLIATQEAFELNPQPGEEALTPDQIMAKRYGALTPEQRAARDAYALTEAARGDAFAREAIEQYVTLEPEQIFDEDKNASLTAGAELVTHFGARIDVLRDLLAEIYIQNKLSDQEKKAWSSRRALPPTSNAPADPGERPASTAAPAPPAATGTPAAATDAPAAIPSGSTPTSPCTSVPS